MKHFVVMKQLGRCGNQFYQIAAGLAFAKKYELDFYVSGSDGQWYDYFPQFVKRDRGGSIFEERRDENGNPSYAPFPDMKNAFFIGYWQSFKYFDDYRKDILEAFAIPYEPCDAVSIHVRRGDYLEHSDSFPPLPLEYYQNAVQVMNGLGHFKFKVFSDDIEYCKTIFTVENFDEKNTYEFSEGKTELEDLSLMSSCQHNILANSSFSFVASWLNQNERKMVLCPPFEKMFKGCNKDMIPADYAQVSF